jgi:hypothetical protein
MKVKENARNISNDIVDKLEKIPIGNFDIPSAKIIITGLVFLVILYEVLIFITSSG